MLVPYVFLVFGLGALALAVIGAFEVLTCRSPLEVPPLPPARVGRPARLPARRVLWGRLIAGALKVAIGAPATLCTGFLFLWTAESEVTRIVGVVLGIATVAAALRCALRGYPPASARWPEL